MFTMIISLLLLSLCALSLGNQHLICKNIDDVFSLTQEPGGASAARRLRGPPGKRGIPGARGDVGLRGPPGPPGAVDYQRIREMINERVQEGLEEMTKKLEEMLTNHTIERHTHDMSLEDVTTASDGLIQSTTDRTVNREKGCRKLDGLLYDGVCYVLISEENNYAGATAQCKQIGGLLAEIHDRAHQDALTQFIRSNMGQSSVVGYWVGVTYRHPNLQYRSGKEVAKTHLKWFSTRYPLTDGNWRVALELRTHGNQNGIFNNGDMYLRAICEMKNLE